MKFKDFISNLPNRVAPEAIEGASTSFHFNIDGDEGGQYTLNIDDGKMDVKEGIHGEAKCSVSAKDKNIEKVLSGDANAMMAVLTGKIKISNQGELMKYAKILGLIK